MRTVCLFALLACLRSGGVFAATLATWDGPTGSWSDGTKWNTGSVPPQTSVGGTSDEIKITNVNTICTIDSDIGTYQARSNVAAGSTLEIVDGGWFATYGEYRFGDANATGNGSIGYGVQTGGSVMFKDLILGRYTSTTGRETGQGYYTISGGTMTFIDTPSNGRLYVGSGMNNGYCEGTFTVSGAGGTITMKQLHVGSNGTLSSYPGKGTVVFEIDDDGVSPIVLTQRYSLTFGTYLDQNESHLVLNAIGTPPATTIVLVDVEALDDQNLGVFDTMTGGPAHAGAEVVVGDKIYSLTYQHAVGGGIANDIALLYQGNVSARAHNPSPANGADAELTLSALSWVNPAPQVGGTPIYCDVYFGTEPNLVGMDKVSLGANVSTVAINTTNFPKYGSLVNYKTYYWKVDCHDASRSPSLISGFMWTFYIDDNEPPQVFAGADQAVWLGKSGTAGQETVTLNGVTSDDGEPNPPGYLTKLWTQVANEAPEVAVINNDQDVASVTFTARGEYEFMLTASDGDKQVSDTVKVFVGDDACDASHLSTGQPYHPADVNKDCVVDITDFVELIAEDWLVCTDTLNHCGF